MNAAEVYLVGEDVSFLRSLSFELNQHGIASRLIHERDTMIAFLSQTEPAMVILAHVEPLDLFLLNPRDHGYMGLLVLLSPEAESSVAAERLRPTHVLGRTLLMRSICERIAYLMTEPRPPP